MLKFLADENFDNMIVRGLFRRNPTLDVEEGNHSKIVAIDIDAY